MKRSRPVSDIREAVLLHQREELRAELLKLAMHLTQCLNRCAGQTRPRWVLDMEARRTARIAVLLRRLGGVQEKLWRMRVEINT